MTFRHLHPKTIHVRTWLHGALLILVILCLPGCFDRQELEQQAFVTSLGVDSAPAGQIDCTFVIALPKSQSSGGPSSGGEPLAGSGPVTYRAHTIPEALLLANSSVERTMSLTHLTDVIFGEDVAKSGVARHLQALLRYREFRQTTFMWVAKGKAKDILASLQPMLEQSPNRFADDVSQVDRFAAFSPIRSRLHDFVNALAVPHEGTVLPVFAVNEAVKGDPKGEKGPTQSANYTPGQVSRSGGDPVEWMGGAVFRGDKLTGYLTGREVMMYRILQGTIQRTKYDVADPLFEGKHIDLSLRRERAVKYTVNFRAPMTVTAEVRLEADLLNSEAPVDYTNPKYRMPLEKALTKQLHGELSGVLKKLFSDYNSDAIPVCRQIRSSFSTHAAYKHYPWNERIKDAKINVIPVLHIRRYGVQNAPQQVTT